MAKYKVIVTDDRFDTYAPEREALLKADAELVVCDAKDQNEVRKIVKDADGVLLNLHTIGKEEIAAMQNCKVISRYGIGYNNVNVEEATNKGIWVARVPEYGADEAVSDQAMALILDCVRRTTHKHNRILKGEWNLMKDYKIHQIKGSCIGIIGFGSIGKVLQRKIAGFKPSEILVYDPFVLANDIEKFGAKKVELKELLKSSDIISIHCPETEESENMINAASLKLMKNSAILVNTARGGIINQDDLIDALKNKMIFCAGLDVFTTDPLPMDSPLRTLDNVVISDHTGFYSDESLSTLKSRAAANIAEVLLGHPPIYPLNDIK